MKRKLVALFVILLAAVCYGTPAKAEGLTISPLRVTLSAQTRTAGFILISQEPDPTLIQVHLFAWGQRDGADELTPTDDLLVGPPIFTIQPGDKQLIRVGLRVSPTATREQTYRIIIAEVPVHRAATGINFAFRLSMPIFIAPQNLAPPSLRWKATKTDPLHVRLTLDNVGDQHVQVRSLRIVSSSQTDLVHNAPIATYVLAGQSRSWLVKLDRPWRGTAMRLTASTDQGELQQAIAVSNP